MKALDTLEESVKAGRLKKGEDDEYTEKTYLTIEILIQLRRISASIRSLAQAFGYSKSEMGRLIFMIAGLGWGYKNEVYDV